MANKKPKFKVGERAKVLLDPMLILKVRITDVDISYWMIGDDDEYHWYDEEQLIGEAQDAEA